MKNVCTELYIILLQYIHDLGADITLDLFNSSGQRLISERGALLLISESKPKDKVMVGLHRSICLQYSAFIFMLRVLKGYQALQVTMSLVVNHLLVKAVDVLAMDLM